MKHKLTLIQMSALHWTIVLDGEVVGNVKFRKGQWRSTEVIGGSHWPEDLIARVISAVAGITVDQYLIGQTLSKPRKERSLTWQSSR